MKDLEISRRLLPLRILLSCAGAILAANAAPAPTTPPLQVTFAADVAPDGQLIESKGIPMGDEALVVSMCYSGLDPKSVDLKNGPSKIPLTKVTWDPVSRLLFLSVESSQHLVPSKWKVEVGKDINAILRTQEPEGSFECQSIGWVKHVEGKIFPFALMNVNFSRAVPQPGTAIVDDTGEIVGIVFQGSGNGNNGYAIPAEAVHRVQRDLIKGGSFIRGWIGLALQSTCALPQISRILKDSPAELAGIHVEDVITRIGSRQIADYADAANAFFYLVPGEPITIGLLRGEEPLEFTLTPTGPPADL